MIYTIIINFVIRLSQLLSICELTALICIQHIFISGEGLCTQVASKLAILLLMNNLRCRLDIGIYLVGIDNPITERSGNFLEGLHLGLTVMAKNNM